MSGPILALNCGSSSLKFGVYTLQSGQPRLYAEGEAEQIGTAASSFWFQKSGAQRQESKQSLGDHAAALKMAQESLLQAGAEAPQAIGHRIVHGGPRVRQHQRLTPDILHELQQAEQFAPLHVPAALKVVEASRTRYPGVPQFVCLDTAFHNSLPDVSRTLALPEDLRSQGVERYGFHGVSLESILPQLRPVPAKLVVAHLGNGSSITAIHDGISMDTSMSFTPNAGILMGTRCGDLDPGVVTYLQRRQGATADQIDALLNQKSGLLGVSDISSDVRTLEQARSSKTGADLALRMFCYQAAKTIAGMAAVLSGIDTLVFTGGIGEHSQPITDEISGFLKFLGNMDILKLPAQEDLQIAIITARLANLT